MLVTGVDFLEREPHHQGILLRDLLHPVLFKFIVQGNTEFKVLGKDDSRQRREGEVFD